MAKRLVELGADVAICGRREDVLDETVSFLDEVAGRACASRHVCDIRDSASVDAMLDEVWRAGSANRPSTLVHGDWHLGQLGRLSATEAWLLIDVDDLGVGDPAWDLARPAGFWAAGLIPDDDWHLFVQAYRDGGGPALPPGDPWPVLEPFARAAVVAAAAHHPDDDLLVAACARMG